MYTNELLSVWYYCAIIDEGIGKTNLYKLEYDLTAEQFITNPIDVVSSDDVTLHLDNATILSPGPQMTAVFFEQYEEDPGFIYIILFFCLQ